MDTLAVAGRFDLTDAQWASGAVVAAPSQVGSAVVVDQTAADRRDPVAGPGRCTVAGHAGGTGPGKRSRVVPSVATRRCLAAIVTALQALADAAGRITWDVSVDSTIARAHQHAAGARKRGICRPSRRAGSPQPEDHALGRRGAG